MRFILVFLLLWPATAGSLDAGDIEDDRSRLDPVVASIVRMLEAQVAPSAVVEWLKRSPMAPGELSPDDLIALARAGAPDDLVLEILERSNAATDPPPAPDRAAPASPRPPPTFETLPVRFEVRYSPPMVDYQETPWDLFIYVDGRPLARADGWASHETKHRDHLTFVEPLEAGPHVIRLLQEKHQLESKRKNRWSHRARVQPEPFLLDLDAEGEWIVRIQVRDSDSFVKGGQAEYEITRDGELIAEGSGPAPGKRWPALCEEVETGLTPRELDSSVGRKRLSGCVSWASLWKAGPAAPERAAVRAELQEHGFDPGAMPANR